MSSHPRVPSSSTRVNMVVALKAEARPLIARYDLKPAGQSGFYSSGDLGLRLVISGVGRANASRAVERIHQDCVDDAPAAWLNIGIAGHGTALPGTALLADEVLERASGRRLYPRGEAGVPSALATTPLCTVDEPEAAYQAGWAYDMEGSGFLDSAIRISPFRPVQCLKIVADGPTHSWKALTAAVIEELVASCLEAVDSVLDAAKT
jgi:hypothetical protein